MSRDLCVFVFKEMIVHINSKEMSLVVLSIDVLHMYVLGYVCVLLLV